MNKDIKSLFITFSGLFLIVYLLACNNDGHQKNLCDKYSWLAEENKIDTIIDGKNFLFITKKRMAGDTANPFAKKPGRRKTLG